MADHNNEKKSKLGNYLAYGMTFGLLGGSILSTIGFMFEIVFIQIAGVGIGFSLGMTVGALLYYFENSK